MTVSQLIAELQKLDGDLDVIIGRDWMEATDIRSVAHVYWVRKPGQLYGITYECSIDCEDGEPIPVVILDPRR